MRRIICGYNVLPGLQLEEGLSPGPEIDDALEKELDFAFDDRRAT